MPKERRTSALHRPSAKLGRSRHSLQNESSTGLEIGVPDAPVAETGPAEDDKLVDIPSTLTKKEKQQLKREALLDRLYTSASTYTKAQRRRFNKKQREQIGGGLLDMKAAISMLDSVPPIVTGSAQQPDETQAASGGSGPSQLIGEGKGAPLSKNQRQKALQLERLRHPMIISDKRYSSNPFQTIRTHAQNTLVRNSKHVS